MIHHLHRRHHHCRINNQHCRRQISICERTRVRSQEHCHLFMLVSGAGRVDERNSDLEEEEQEEEEEEEGEEQVVGGSDGGTLPIHINASPPQS